MTSLHPLAASIDAALLARPWPRLLLGALAELAGVELVTSKPTVRNARAMLSQTPGTSPEVHARLRDLEIWLSHMNDIIILLLEHAFAYPNPEQKEHYAWLLSISECIDLNPDEAQLLITAFFHHAHVVFAAETPRLNQEALLAEANDASRPVPRILHGDEILQHFGELVDRSPPELLEGAFLPLFSELPDLPCVMREFAESLDSTFPDTSAQILSKLRSHKEYRRLARDLPVAPTTLELVEHWACSPSFVKALKARKPSKPIPPIGSLLSRRAAHRTT